MKIMISKPKPTIEDDLGTPYSLKELLSSGRLVYRDRSLAGWRFWVGPLYVHIQIPRRDK